MRRVARPAPGRSITGHLLTGWIAGLGLTTKVMAATPLPPVDDPSWTDRYDEHFRKYAKRYFGPGHDWRWFKSQAIAESTLNPRARSPAGALGLMQILPSTFGDIRRSNPSIKSLRDPRWNIAAGIYYDRQLYKRWGERFGQFDDKLDYTFASYNAGFGGMSRAYRKAGNPSAPLPWSEVAPHAPAETRSYVAKINGLMTEVQAAEERDAQERAEREHLAAEAERQAAEAQAEEGATDKPKAGQGPSLRERLATWLRRDEPDGETPASASTASSDGATRADGATVSADTPSLEPEAQTATPEASEPEAPDASASTGT